MCSYRKDARSIKTQRENERGDGNETEVRQMIPRCEVKYQVVFLTEV